MDKKVLITGSSGLVGSEAVSYFDERGWEVYGIDNNMRSNFFGTGGDTSRILEQLAGSTRRFAHFDQDIREREEVFEIVQEVRPELILHAAAQPSHDLASHRPFEDFEVNAVATLNLLEAARQVCPESPFILMSTNKVYGDAPNDRELVELDTRWDYARPEDHCGIDETCRIDGSLHSLFGVSKAAADLMVQEYGRYFSIPTLCLRCGCITGSRHSGVELHGFLSYLVRTIKEERIYRIYGYKGKQVRDNIHPFDICTLVDAFFENPQAAAVYNLGGGRENSVSVLEAISAFEERLGQKLQWEYVDEPRKGDHICYISDLRHLRRDYPNWQLTRSMDDIFTELTEVS